MGKNGKNSESVLKEMQLIGPDVGRTEPQFLAQKKKKTRNEVGNQGRNRVLDEELKSATRKREQKRKIASCPQGPKNQHRKTGGTAHAKDAGVALLMICRDQNRRRIESGRRSHYEGEKKMGGFQTINGQGSAGRQRGHLGGGKLRHPENKNFLMKGVCSERSRVK